MKTKRTAIGRRDFLRLLSAGVATTGLATFPSSVIASGGTSKVMRIATWESGGVKESMDPGFSYQESDACRVGLVYDRLFRIDSSYTPHPELAVSWHSNQNADQWTIELRKGVKFHNGKEFTAKDVVYTYKRLLDPKNGSAAAASLTAISADGIEAVDDYTVKFTLPEPIADLPLVISTRHTFIVPEGSKNEDLRINGIGTGPFKQKKFIPGELISYFVKNENYWEPGLPKVDMIELLSITEGTARNAALQSGEIDLSLSIDLAGMAALAKDKRVRVISARSPYVIDMVCWCDTPPFDDVRVRQAMKYCVDRDILIKTAALGHANIANDQPVAPWIRYSWEVEPRKQNYEKAKALLKEAGYENGLKLKLYTGDASPGMVAMAQVYKEMAAPAGIMIEVIQTPADSYWSEIWMKKSFHCESWVGRPADEALFIAYHSKAEWNTSHFRNKEFDEAIETARKTKDENKRAVLYQKAQRILSEQGGTIIPYFMDTLAASRSNVEGWEPHPTSYVKDFRYVDFSS